VANLNGGSGVILVDAGKIAASVTFAYDRSGCATDIFVVRNPEKLEHLSVHG
jgi:RNA polymerase sigma-70 factor (ECF subfamily)